MLLSKCETCDRKNQVLPEKQEASRLLSNLEIRTSLKYDGC